MRAEFIASIVCAGLTAATPVALRARVVPVGVDEVGRIANEAAAACNVEDECRTKEQAAPLLDAAMKRYELCSAGEVAGVLALTAFESVHYQHKRNVSPGRPGQGTCNMQLFPNNLEYARSFPELAPQVDAIVSADPNPGAVPDNYSNATKNAILDLVVPDQYNFGSGAWFLKNKCSTEIQAQLRTGTDDGFLAYMGCVGVTMDTDRRAFWDRAKEVFGLTQ
jgi:hypothetical protein